jgi:PadR family transcriptional regulator PadR
MLSQLGPDPHGGLIRETAEVSARRMLAPGAVYTALDRLERRGLVTSTLGEPTAKRGGKRRRLYRLEPAGKTAMNEAHSSLLSLVQSLAGSAARKS